MYSYRKKKCIYKYSKMNRKDLIKKIKDFLNENKEFNKELRLEFIFHTFLLFGDPFKYCCIDLNLFEENLEKKNLLEEHFNTIFESFNYSILKELYNRIATNNLLLDYDYDSKLHKTLFFIDDEPYLKKMKELSFDFNLHFSHF